MWDPDFDPYEQLMLAHDNINHLAAAFNNQHSALEILKGQYNHQQEVIKQLIFQNQKLNELIAINRTEVATLKTELEFNKLK